MNSIFGPGASFIIVLFIICLGILWILTIVWANRDAKERDGNHFFATLLTIVPFFGVIAYILLRPSMLKIDKENQELDISLKSKEILKFGICSNCGLTIKEDYIFCPKCNTKLRDKCLKCDSALDLNWDVCPYCGTKKVNKTSFINSKDSSTTKEFNKDISDNYNNNQDQNKYSLSAHSYSDDSNIESTFH